MLDRLVGVPFFNADAYKPAGECRLYATVHLAIHVERRADFNGYGVRGSSRNFWFGGEAHATSLCPLGLTVVQQ